MSKASDYLALVKRSKVELTTLEATTVVTLIMDMGAIGKANRVKVRRLQTKIEFNMQVNGETWIGSQSGKARGLRKAMQAMREKGLPIISDTTGGIYMAADRDEALAYADGELTSLIKTLLFKRAMIKRTVRFFGQQPIPEEEPES